MNKWVLSGIASIFLIASLPINDVLAVNLKDLKNEKQQIEQKKDSLNSSIKEKKNEISSNENTIDNYVSQISSLNGKIEETARNIEIAIDEINETTKEIEVLRDSIADLERRIKERDEVLRDRLRAMQVRGNKVNYIDVLLGANSFADFIDRFSAVNTLMDADRKIMKQQEEDIAQLEAEKKLVEQKLAEQEENRKKLENLKASLESQKQEKNRLIAALEKEQQRLYAEKEALEDDLHEAYEISKELEQQIVAEQNRLAAIAREAERKRQAAAAASKNSGGSSSVAAPPVSSGTWTKPANGRFTSGFGWRTHPIYGTARQHRGVDIANSVGTPIVAAADGVVSFAGYMGGLGNAVMITHSINGQIFTSVYGHMSSIGTSKGQHVSKGQYIGGMGSTGASTGSHLHFEIHVGNFSGSGPSAVNPLQYISF